ncbi:MAG: hypothetical protein ACK5YU_04715 [Burkholderiales bacterium]|jgi:hypothetical protein|nr:hypothetical protein [Betaproteobacteria bacterium]
MKPAKPQHPVSAFADAETLAESLKEAISATFAPMIRIQAKVFGASVMIRTHADFAGDDALHEAADNADTAYAVLRKVAHDIDTGILRKSGVLAAHLELREAEQCLANAFGSAYESERTEVSDQLGFAASLIDQARIEVDAVREGCAKIAAKLDANVLIAPILERAKQTPRAATSDTNPTQKFATHACNRAATLHAMAEAAGALLASQDFSASHPQAWHAGEVLAEMAAIAQQLTNDSADAQYADTRGAA